MIHICLLVHLTYVKGNKFIRLRVGFPGCSLSYYSHIELPVNDYYTRCVCGAGFFTGNTDFTSGYEH